MSTQTNKLNKSETDKLGKMTTTSSRIRYLLSKGWSRGEVARKLGIIYQWVYNVEHQVVKNPKV